MFETLIRIAMAVLTVLVLFDIRFMRTNDDGPGAEACRREHVRPDPLSRNTAVS